jgi:hypothetical protein
MPDWRWDVSVFKRYHQDGRRRSTIPVSAAPGSGKADDFFVKVEFFDKTRKDPACRLGVSELRMGPRRDPTGSAGRLRVSYILPPGTARSTFVRPNYYGQIVRLIWNRLPGQACTSSRDSKGRAATGLRPAISGKATIPLAVFFHHSKMSWNSHRSRTSWNCRCLCDHFTWKVHLSAITA